MTAARILDMAKARGATIATAESCTGGLVAAALTDVPGSSAVVLAGLVTYANGAKTTYLGVAPSTLATHGAVSEEVAREMAEGALRAANANVAISDTGVAGPGPGEGGIPAGTICFAWSFEHKDGVTTFSETRRFDGDRNAVRHAATDYAINRIWHYHNALTADDARPHKLPEAV